MRSCPGNVSIIEKSATSFCGCSMSPCKDDGSGWRSHGGSAKEGGDEGEEDDCPRFDFRNCKSRKNGPDENSPISSTYVPPAKVEVHDTPCAGCRESWWDVPCQLTAAFIATLSIP